MPRRPSFLLKIKIKILDIFYISLSLPLTGEEGVRTLASIKHSLTLSVPHSVSQSCVILSLFLPLSLSLTGEEGVHTLASPVHWSYRERKRKRRAYSKRSKSVGML